MGKNICKKYEKRKDYRNLKRTIQVLITNFEVKKLKEQEYHTKWEIIEEKRKKSNIDKGFRDTYNRDTKDI